MRKTFGCSWLLVLIVLLMAGTASADPRMEIRDNFCHCILDPIDTDNEVFIAECQPVITVEKVVEDPAITQEEGGEKVTDINVVTCDGYVAKGYAKVTRKMREDAAPLAAGEKMILTSDDSETPCVMVESNGRAYKSHDWKSSIKVGEASQWGVVKVVYEVTCYGGVTQ
jgi:hypothetical protein